MRLLPEAIANFLTGTHGWEVVENTLRPQRMPAIMQPLYEPAEGSNVRMLCTAGVRLRFVSDTTRLNIAYTIGVSARANFKCDLFVDGKRVCETGTGPDARTPQWSGLIYENNHAKERTFDLWLPHVAQVDVAELVVDDDCFIEPAEPLPVRWLMYGDSITQGMDAKLPSQTAFCIAALANNAEVFNLGIGGAKAITELATTVPDGHFDIVSIAYGTNDFNQGWPVQDYYQNTLALVEKCLTQFPNAPILVITPLPWVDKIEPNKNGEYFAAFRTILEPFAHMNERVILIDGLSLIPDDAAMFSDKVHPNAKGFAIYGKKLGEHVRDALAK